MELVLFIKKRRARKGYLREELLTSNEFRHSEQVQQAVRRIQLLSRRLKALRAYRF